MNDPLLKSSAPGCPGRAYYCTTMERAEVLTRARKLRELARRGVDGERDNAQRLLIAFLDRHGLSEADIDYQPPPPPPACDEVVERAWARTGNPGLSYMATKYATTAVDAYVRSCRWLGLTPTDEEAFSFVREVVKLARTLFP